IMDVEQSGVLRDRLLAEIGNIASTEAAAGWAREGLLQRTSSQGPMPSVSRRPLNAGCPSSLQPGQTLRAIAFWQPPLRVLTRRARPQVLTLIDPRASTRAFSPFRRRAATATVNTCAPSASSHA